MAKSTTKTTNEQEFQGAVVSWLNEFISTRKPASVETATQEKPQQTGKRNDIVVWVNRASARAFLSFELKTPTTPISDPGFFNDALQKAIKWKSHFFVLWNMQQAELYVTPASESDVPPVEPIAKWPLIKEVTSVESWLIPNTAIALRSTAESILDYSINAVAATTSHEVVIDAEVFVARLSDAIASLRKAIYSSLRAEATKKAALRKKLNLIATEQGFNGFVEDIDQAIAGQVSYRLVGQILFYFALRRKLAVLPELVIQKKDPLPAALRPFWDKVRKFDYEALYKIEEYDSLVPLTEGAQDLVRELIVALGSYDWASLSDDVLGTVFERLIPRQEQILLGQFYTPKPVADLLASFVLDGENPSTLDPGCGSGTFLMSAYERAAKYQGKEHGEILPKLWGFDLSPFATELAAINLFRQDLSSFNNFPRIVPGSFFDRQVGQIVEFPPARATSGGGFGKQNVPVPQFDAILANPPYLRSQNQDDLDPKYKTSLFAVAAAAGVQLTSKMDLFGFFLFHGASFLQPGGRLGFVTPASWLTADYGQTIQRFLLNNLRLKLVIASDADSFFTQVDVNAVLFVAEKVEEAADESDFVRFLTLKKPIAHVCPGGPNYWQNLMQFASSVEATMSDTDNENYRLKCVPVDTVAKKTALIGKNWAKFARAPLSYYELFGSHA